MKNILAAAFALALGILLASCSEKTLQEKTGKLIRIDVQSPNAEERIITDQDELDTAEKAFENVEWQPNAEVKMAREEDVTATFFYDEDASMPERLYEYVIWFEEDDSATLISNEENEGYGKLNPTHSRNLKNVFVD